MTAPIRFHGGLWGAFLPLLAFVAAVVTVTAHGMISIQAYFAPLVAVVGLVILLARDRAAACDAMLSGVADRTVAVMVFAFLGAGVFGALLVSSGVVESIVWLGEAAGVRGVLFILVSFLVAAVVATAIGTSTGTVVTCVPVLYPAGVALGAHPALILGALYSGARFGDNLAPISDTTVASAFTQGTEVGEVVRTRIKYALVAAALSVVLYLVVGLVMAGGPTTGMDMAGAGATGGGSANPAALLMLLAPLLTIVLCLKKRPLIQALWAGIFTAIPIGLLLGTFTPAQLYALEPPRRVTGAITDGLTGMRDVIFLLFFIMAVLGALRRAGALEAVVQRLMRFATTPKKAEFSIFALVSVLCPLCAGNTPAMLVSGPMVSDIGKRFGIPATRRANLMDLAGNGVTENLPHINTMLALAGVMIATHEATGVPLVPLLTVGALAFHPMMLSLVAIGSIVTGWGASRG